MSLGICGLLCMYESTIKATDTVRGILLRTLRIPSTYLAKAAARFMMTFQGDPWTECRSLGEPHN